MNVRSVNNKALCIHDYIVENDLDILFICETWLGSDLDDISISQLLPPAYKILHQPRIDRRGRGVAIVFKECLQLVKFDCSDISANLEYITCHTSINKHKYTLCSVYRPPSSSDAQFIEDWNALLSTLVICEGEIIICGDVNLHLDNTSNHYTRLFTHSLNACDFIQNIQGPTHYQGHTLDVFITRDSSTLINDLTVIDPMLCYDDDIILQDHYAIIARLNIEKQSPKNKSITFRKLRDIDLNDFKSDITNSPMLNNCALPLDVMVKNYNTSLSITLDNHAPIVCKIITVRKNALWYDNTLLSAKRLRRKLERKWRETKSISDYREYRNQSIAVNKNLETARIKHYNNKICQQQGNSKVIFSVAKKLTGDNSDPVLPHHTDSATLANRFSAFFHDKIQTIKANIVGMIVIHVC